MTKIEKIRCDGCEIVADSCEAGWLYFGRGVVIALKGKRLYEMGKAVDFCSTDCLKVWLDAKIEELLAKD